MIEYLFLFILGLVFISFAVVQDLRTREVANWLNFSLIAFALAYRLFYSLFSKDLMFFVFGVLGVITFVILAYAFYYGRIFAGGDAKLLMGLGGILPIETFSNYLLFGGAFILLLFSTGVIWTLVFSLTLIKRNRKEFVRGFKKQFSEKKSIFLISLIVALLIGILSFAFNAIYFSWFAFLVLIFPLLYVYVRSIEISCMIKLTHPSKLTEGDWLAEDVRIQGKTIKKSVHGLSKKEIELLRKAKKKVWIKNGVPFTPAFLLAFVVFLIFYFKGFFYSALLF